QKFDVVITEIGGTVGDIESLPYIEAVRQLKWELGHDALVIHLTLVPYLAASGELKTKPTQHSVKSLLETGVQPEVLVLRTEHELPADVPLKMREEKLDQTVCEKLGLDLKKEPKLKEWTKFLTRLQNPKSEVKIGLVGKYVELHDAYKSIAESFIHAGSVNECKVKVEWIHSEKLNDKSYQEELKDLKGILVAPGFGHRGLEGKILAVKYARENNIPFLGICLGMQVAVIEYARNVLKLENADSLEMNPKTPHPVINLMEEQKNVTEKGGTMRL
ncbi:CTP synthase, partial [Aduncisulcus paluster]